MSTTPMNTPNTWRRLLVGGEPYAFNTAQAILDAVTVLAKVGSPPGVAIFVRLDKRTGESHFYFTPEAGVIAESHGAVDCATPSWKEAGGFLCGDKSVIERLL